MCSGRGDGPLRPPGFPIRKSPDRSLVADSPGLIAGSYVLLRLLVPRHPPCALTNLATTDVMLASTVQFSRYGRSRPPLPSRVRRPVLAEGASRPFPPDPTPCSAREPLLRGCAD